jgi:predicted MFS family arabinose efflux permease
MMKLNATFLLMIGVVLVGANAFVLSPILPEVAASLHTTPAHVTRATASFGAATALSALILAAQIDRQGVRRSLAVSAAVLALAQVFSLLAQSWLGLAMAQALAGAAVGVMLPAIYAATTATAPPGQETARLGRVLTGWALSLVLAVPVSAWMTEHMGWRPVYGILAMISGLVSIGMWHSLPKGMAKALLRRSGPLHALRLPGVPFILGLSLMYMTAFYGTYAYFGEGIRGALNLSASGAGFYVLIYGLGFGVAGLCAGRLPIPNGRGYMVALFSLIALTYLAWRYSIGHAGLAMLNIALWGFFNQFALNAMILALNKRAQDARGAVMGLNSAVTYSAVFAGPLLMGLIYPGFGFRGVATLAAACVALAALALALRPRRHFTSSS